MPPLEPMTSTCRSCGSTLTPVLTERVGSYRTGPLPAEVPIVMRCVECADGADGDEAASLR